jgi:predicted CXXCH cytochrome family protein
VIKQTEQKYAHAPVKDPGCKQCHDPHVGQVEGLLGTPVRELCSTCHDPSAPEFLAQHRGFHAEGAKCTSCHDPHGSKDKGLMLAFSHKPYAEKDCMVCHAGQEGFKAEGTALCVTCHGGHAKDAEKPVVHAAITTGRGCINCHSPHSGRTKELLVRDDVTKTCQTCHDRKLFTAKYQHPDIGGCATCHDPHGSGNPGILVEPQQTLCNQCHDASESHYHPYSGPQKDPRTGQDLTCTSCHNPHGTDHEQLLTHDKTRLLCVQCHQGGNLEARPRGGR